MRRSFLKLLAGLPLIGAIPAVRAAAWEPKTVAELVPAVEALFGGRVGEIFRSFEEFEFVPLGLPTHYERPVYRMVPMTWRLIGGSEAELVGVAWRDLSRLAWWHGDGTLYWRQRPMFGPRHDFDSGRVESVLRFRVAVLPADWQGRAQAGEGWNRLRGMEWAVKEGSPTRRLS